MGKTSSFLIFRQVFYTKHWNLKLLKENLSKNTEKERLNRWFNIGMASFYVKGLHLSQGRLSLLWLLPLSLSLLPLGQVPCCRNSTHLPPNIFISALMLKTLHSWVSYTPDFKLCTVKLYLSDISPHHRTGYSSGNLLLLLLARRLHTSNNSAGLSAIQVVVYGGFPHTNKTNAGLVSLLQSV